MFAMLAILLALLSPSSDPPNPERETEEPSRKGAHALLESIDQEIERARREGRFEPLPAPPVVEEPVVVVLDSDVGEATFYGGRFHGRRTASGERFDEHALTAAHRSYPFGTIVRVTNLENGRSIVLRITDRGPFGRARKAARKIIDVSTRAARELGFIEQGRIVARVEVLEWGAQR